MKDLKLSVIVPTHNRPGTLAETLACLRRQSLSAADYEIVVVDDGSSPPVELLTTAEWPRYTLVRLEGLERSAARNAGAAVGRGVLLVFVDDDMVVGRDFLAAHLRAQAEWPHALVVGAVRLPGELVATPFGRFRQKLEQHNLPRTRGLTPTRNLCTAQNMSLTKARFDELGGFDPKIVSGEDQDFALRHTDSGGQIVFIPEADALHNDTALDVRSYCRRAEWGSEQMVRFCQRHPDWTENVERNRINGALRLGSEPVSQSARKLLKIILTTKLASGLLLIIARALEMVGTTSLPLDRVYRLLLGAHILRGFRRGLRRFPIGDKQSLPVVGNDRVPNAR